MSIWKCKFTFKISQVIVVVVMKSVGTQLKLLLKTTFEEVDNDTMRNYQTNNTCNNVKSFF